MSSIEGFPMSTHHEHAPQEPNPDQGGPTIPELEADESIAPRPEEEIADILRAKPDVEDHSQHSE